MKKAALLLIDVQKAFDEDIWGNRNNPDAESNIAKLLSRWRYNSLPIIHVKHCSIRKESPLHPDQEGNQFKDEARPLEGEVQFSKTVNSAFIGTGLDVYLKDHDLNALVVVGLTTDHCVSTSVRMAANLGFQVTLVSDATATFEREGPDGKMYSADIMHAANLASLHDEFCDVQMTTQVLEMFSSGSQGASS